MSTIVLQNGRMIFADGIREDCYAILDGAAVGEIGQGEPKARSGAQVIDCDGRLITPGFIDLQVNGGGGYMFSIDIDRSHYVEIGRAHASLGVTTICPTVVTGPLDDMIESVSILADLCSSPEPGMCSFAGIHVEGPFLDEEKRGGHTLRYLRAPSVEWTERLLEAARGYLKIFTLAPELPGADAVIDLLVKNGVFVSAGHTAADASTLQDAVRSGLRGVTHIFNGMDGVHNRVPGVAGVALSNEDLYVGLIADLLHVHAETALMTIRAKALDRLYLTTDAVSPIGSNATSFDLYGVTVTVRDGGCYTDEGILAGTATPLPKMYGNVLHRLGVAPYAALKMVTTTPARILGREGDLGTLQVGSVADVCVFEGDFAPWCVVSRGVVISQDR